MWRSHKPPYGQWTNWAQWQSKPTGGPSLQYHAAIQYGRQSVVEGGKPPDASPDQKKSDRAR